MGATVRAILSTGAALGLSGSVHEEAHLGLS